MYSMSVLQRGPFARAIFLSGGQKTKQLSNDSSSGGEEKNEPTWNRRGQRTYGFGRLTNAQGRLKQRDNTCEMHLETLIFWSEKVIYRICNLLHSCRVSKTLHFSILLFSPVPSRRVLFGSLRQNGRKNLILFENTSCCQLVYI